MRWFQIFHINYKPPHFVIKECHYFHLNNNFPSLSIQNGNIISHKQSLRKHFPMSQNVPSLLSEVSVSLWMLKLERGSIWGNYQCVHFSRLWFSCPFLWKWMYSEQSCLFVYIAEDGFLIPSSLFCYLCL